MFSIPIGGDKLQITSDIGLELIENWKGIVCCAESAAVDGVIAAPPELVGLAVGGGGGGG